MRSPPTWPSNPGSWQPDACRLHIDGLTAISNTTSATGPSPVADCGYALDETAGRPAASDWMLPRFCEWLRDIAGTRNEQLRHRVQCVIGMQMRKKNCPQIEPGLIYEDRNISARAFRVRHGDMKDAFGFRFETRDKTIVISGDTSPIETIVENSHGCDVLIHESYSRATYDKVSRPWQAYRRKYHTSSNELADLATRVKPGLLILYHRANAGGAMALPDPEDVLLDEVRSLYDGNVVTGHDFDVF